GRAFAHESVVGGGEGVAPVAVGPGGGAHAAPVQRERGGGGGLGGAGGGGAGRLLGPVDDVVACHGVEGRCGDDGVHAEGARGRGAPVACGIGAGGRHGGGALVGGGVVGGGGVG